MAQDKQRPYHAMQFYLLISIWENSRIFILLKHSLWRENIFFSQLFLYIYLFLFYQQENTQRRIDWWLQANYIKLHLNKWLKGAFPKLKWHCERREKFLFFIYANSKVRVWEEIIYDRSREQFIVIRFVSIAQCTCRTTKRDL